MRRPHADRTTTRLTVGLLAISLLLGHLSPTPAIAQATAPTLAATPPPGPMPTATVPRSSPTPAPRPAANPGAWLDDPLGAIARQVAGWVRAAVTALLTAAVRPFVEDVAARWELLSTRFDFMTTTPTALTYEWSAVVMARERLRAVANAALGLLALLAAYNVFRPHVGLADEPLLTAFTRLSLAALAANTSHWWTALLIDLNNALIRLYAPAALTGLFHSDNLLGWLTMQALAAPLFLLFGVVTIVAFCALAVQLWGRLIILNVLLVLCPLAIVLAATPQTAGWAARWRDQFLAATFSQALSLIALALATQLAAPIFTAGQPGMSALAALGGLWLAYQAPRWLRDHAIPSVVGLAGVVSPLAAVATVEVVARRLRSLTRPIHRADDVPAAGGSEADGGAILPAVPTVAADRNPTAGPGHRAPPLSRVAVATASPLSSVSPPDLGMPEAWDDHRGRWVTATTRPGGSALVQPLAHLGVAVVLPQDQPYVLDHQDGSAWLADPAALPADRRRIRLGRDAAGSPVALVTPDDPHVTWDSARSRFMAPRVETAGGTDLMYAGDAVEPAFLAKPTPDTVKDAGGQPETLVWDDRRRAWLAAPLAAGPVVWHAAAGAFVRRPADTLASVHPVGTAWVVAPAEPGGHAAFTPAEAVAPVTVPAIAYPAAPIAPRVVPMTRRRLEMVLLASMPPALDVETVGRDSSPSEHRRPIGFPGPRDRS